MFVIIGGPSRVYVVMGLSPLPSLPAVFTRDPGESGAMSLLPSAHLFPPASQHLPEWRGASKPVPAPRPVIHVFPHLHRSLAHELLLADRIDGGFVRCATPATVALFNVFFAYNAPANLLRIRQMDHDPHMLIIISTTATREPTKGEG